jgi:hypothetical protein
MKATWQDLEPREWAARAFIHPETKVGYFAAELSTGEGCSEFGGYAFGFFKSASPDWLDLTGEGRPGDSMPLRPFLGLVPEVGVQLERGGPIYFVGHEVLFGDIGAGFAPLFAIGRVRTTCSC